MKKAKFEGKLAHLKTHKIYLNINKLEKGDYKLKLIQNNKIIKTIDFKKE